jgi:hypothetical protein
MAMARTDCRRGVFGLLLAGLGFLTAVPALAATASESAEGIALENGIVRAFFSAGSGYTPSEFRRLPEGQNLLGLCILSYITEGAQYWFQDNKQDEYGIGPVTPRVERGEGFVRLVVTNLAAGQPGHFRVTKTHTLRDGSPVLENEYRLEATGPVPLRGGLSLPLVQCGPSLTRAAVPRADGSLLLGDAAGVRRDEAAAPWAAAYNPETGEGFAFHSPDGAPNLVLSGDRLTVICAAATEGKVTAGTRLRARFSLAAFAGKPLPPALATALARVPGIAAPVRFGRVTEMGGTGFDPNDLSLWERYRESVRRPATFIRPADLARARENVRRHAWAQRLLAAYRSRADRVLRQPADYVERMISETTPLCTLFTMCPECEYAPVHGQYTWNVERPDELQCRGCGTVYPNAKYPEDLRLVTRYGGEQVFTFYGGKHWDFLGMSLRSSWSGAIRAYKNGYMAGAARDLAITYALTGERPYAEKAAEILSRFATVYPRYLVHSGYGEIADMDPHVAAARINDLPADETNCPPNKPDRKLHAGYWTAGRGFSAVGMEGTELSQLAEAYDLVADVIPEAERRRIERDLLLEGTHLLLCDPSLNNKTATNRSAVGEVGMCVGDPRRVRFGLEGLRWFINEWFLADGAASESPAYGNMTLAGIWRFADAVHGYSDPPGYQEESGRIDNLDIYGDARYRSIFQVLADSLLPSLTYPPIADSYLTTGPMRDVVEVMATRLPQPRFRSLLCELSGGDPSREGTEWALFHRDPEPMPALPPAPLPDRFFSAWKLGFLRSGKDGRRGAAVVSASDWGGHHHLDSLNLFYWQDGQELLSDLGYLWDNPDKHHLDRTVAHNLVVVDQAQQRSSGRGGWLHRFNTSPHVKVIEVSSAAYPQTSEYRRTVFLIEHPEGVYLADLFRVVGGETHDYVFHGPNRELTLEGFAGEPAPDLEAYRFTQVRAAHGQEPWRATWTLAEGLRFQALSLPQPGETSLLAEGWGQRTAQEKGATLPYVVRRRSRPAGSGEPLASTFASLFEGSQGRFLVRSAKWIETGVPGAAALGIETVVGTDYVVSAPEGATIRLQTPSGPLVVQGGLAVLSTTGDALRFASLVGGKRLEWNGHRLTLAEPVLRGKVRRIENAGAACWLELDRALPQPATLVGQTITAGRGEKHTGYEIRAVEGARVYVRQDGDGVDVQAADNWELALSATLAAP